MRSKSLQFAIYYLIMIFGFSTSLMAQNDLANYERRIIEHFKQQVYRDSVVSRKSLYPFPFKGNYKVAISDEYVEFDTSQIVLKNPYFNNKYELAEDEEKFVKNFPKSYSVIYDNRLVSLFENGKFSCFKLGNFKRDSLLEHNLNTKKFKYHWIINNQLGGLAGNNIYLWNGNKWEKSKSNFPLKNRPVLFEDDSFIVYGESAGEWGGTAYFFQKLTSKTYFTKSTWTNTVIKDADGYTLLAQLGHNFGSAQIKTIPDPTKLTLVKSKKIRKPVAGEVLGNTDRSKGFHIKFDQWGVQAFSTFKYRGKNLYIVHLAELTFIAEINNSNIEIVNPLFFDGLYTHNPVTTTYGDVTLINLDHYGTGLDREISLLLIKGNKITKIDWNEAHSK